MTAPMQTEVLLERFRRKDAEALGELFEQHALVLDRRKIVAGCPVLGDGLHAPIDLVSLERFKCDRGITEILETHLIEIVAPDVDVEILCPVILHPLVGDGAAG